MRPKSSASLTQRGQQLVREAQFLRPFQVVAMIGQRSRRPRTWRWWAWSRIRAVAKSATATRCHVAERQPACRAASPPAAYLADGARPTDTASARPPADPRSPSHASIPAPAGNSSTKRVSLPDHGRHQCAAICVSQHRRSRCVASAASNDHPAWRAGPRWWRGRRRWSGPGWLASCSWASPHATPRTAGKTPAHRPDTVAARVPDVPSSMAKSHSCLSSRGFPNGGVQGGQHNVVLELRRAGLVVGVDRGGVGSHLITKQMMLATTGTIDRIQEGLSSP